MAEPDPTEVAPWYLRNINQALALDETSGNVYVRTDSEINIANANITIGDVGITSLGNVDISGNTLPVTVEGGNVTATLSGNLAGITGNVTIVDGGGSITVDGNVNANITGGNVTVSGNVGITSLGNISLAGNTLPISGNVGISGTANVILADDASVVISGFSGAVSDAFGRLRVSNPYSLFETQARYFDHQQFASNTSGTANVVYVANQSSYQLNVGSTSGDSVLRETLKPFPYQPGKSQLTLNTFCMNTPKTNLRQRVGLFDANDGVFFENDGTYNYFVIRSGSTGVEERVRQDAWNVDQLNGSGPVTNPSGYTLYPDRTQIMFADVEWLGVGLSLIHI